ncbi:MAG: hypothetical protein GX279_11235 [Clostridiaceae bacterium]|jgi:hypothetical protein|nr:hypothetical protein [Clostridiaceae bacterium]
MDTAQANEKVVQRRFMNDKKSRLLDILAFPKKSFENLTDNKKTLIAGIVLIGAVDLLLPDVAYFFKTLFSGKQTADIVYNACMMAVMILLLGLIDVLFISVPLFDIFRALKIKELKISQNTELKVDPATELKPSYIKVMKIYIMTHFIITPITTAFYFAVSGYINDSPDWLVSLAVAFSLVMNIWFSSIIARGINTIFRFSPLFNRLTFIIVYIWNFIFGTVFSEMIVKWLMKLFR